MKSKLIAIILALFSSDGLIANNRSLPVQPPEPSGQRFVISEYGTLVDVLHADGKSRFGKLELDGFRVSYETNGKTKSVFAIGASKVKGLRPGQVKRDGQSASITITTDDNELEITSRFSLDDVEKKLIIRRSFRNISGGTLKFLLTRQYVDRKLIVDGQSVSEHAKLMQLARGRISAGGNVYLYDCQIKECVEPPMPCLTRTCPAPPQGLTTAVIEEFEEGNLIAVQWNGTRALTKRSAGAATQPANESHFVIQVALE